jgi:hypothetical protein
MTGQPPESLEASGLFAFVPLCEHFHRRFQVKNKLGETKAWASSATAKAMQAHFLCLAHNLMILCEAELVGMTVGGTRPVLPPGAMTLSFP